MDQLTTEGDYQEALLDFEILDHLPLLGFNDPTNAEFMSYLIDAFNNNWKYRGKSNLHQIAFKAFYDIYLIFIYVKVWQIKDNRNFHFNDILNTFKKEIQDYLIDFKIKDDSNFNSKNIFDLSNLKDGEVIKFLKVVGCHKNEQEEYCKFLTVRNHCSHPSGFIQYSESDLSKNIIEIVSFCKRISRKFIPILEEIFEKFLIDNYDLGDDDQIFNDRFIKPNFISRFEVLCLIDFDIRRMNNKENYVQIQSFFYMFKELYKDNI